jgi:predicted SAM-dependent methyltransferase
MGNVSVPVKVHLGCGSFTPPGWINIDGSWNAWISKYPNIKKILKKIRLIPSQITEANYDKDILVHDLRNPLPFQDNSVKAIYASHLLEHLYLMEAKSLLRECHRVLMKDGIIRMVVPDLKSVAEKYLSNEVQSTSEPKADIFNKNLFLRAEAPPAGNIVYKLYTILKDFHLHKWMYDEDSLVYHLKEAGFLHVKKCNLHESLIEDIEVIEKAERVLNEAFGLCVEGIK